MKRPSNVELKFAFRRSSLIGLGLIAFQVLFYFVNPKADMFGLGLAVFVGLIVSTLIFLGYLFSFGIRR